MHTLLAFILLAQIYIPIIHGKMETELRSNQNISQPLVSYLQRLGFQEHIPALDFSFLSTLQTNHIETFSHDTIDCYFKRDVCLDPIMLIKRFLSEHRGGLCFELNGAFCHLLKKLGFKTTLLSSHVYRVEKAIYNLPIDTHAVILVELDAQRYLVDVGFADSCRAPINIDTHEIKKDVSGSYQVIKHNEIESGLYKFLSGEWLLQYTFTFKPRALDEFQENLHFVCTSKEHEFSYNLFYTLPNRTGHKALLCLTDQTPIQKKFLLKNEHGNTKKVLATFSEVKELLITEFGMAKEIVNMLKEY